MVRIIDLKWNKKRPVPHLSGQRNSDRDSLVIYDHLPPYICTLNCCRSLIIVIACTYLLQNQCVY